MCYICSCFAWILDLIQRALTFLLTCWIVIAVSIGFIVACAAGVAYGYNYCMAEFLTLTRADVTVYLRRGQFYDAPDIKGRPKLRRSGDGVFEGGDEYQQNLTSDYEAELRKQSASEPKSLSETWVKADDTRKYAERLTKYAGRPIKYAERLKEYAERPTMYAERPIKYAERPNEYAGRPNEYAGSPIKYADRPNEYKYAERPIKYVGRPKSTPITVDEGVQVEDVKGVLQKTSTETMYQILTTLPPLFYSISQNPLAVLTTVWKTGTSEMVMRRFRPQDVYVNPPDGSHSQDSARESDEFFYRVSEDTEGRTEVTRTRATKPSQTHESQETINVERKENVVQYVPMRHWGATTTEAPIIPPEVAKEQIDEEPIVYKPV